jgi:hypothetical protein
MKPNRMLLCAAFAAAMVLSAATPSAAAQYYPSVPLAISGTLYYTTNNDTLAQGSPIIKVSYNNQALINLLNASSNALSSIKTVTGKSKIPAGSYFLWNPYDETLTITNNDGFSFPLEGSHYEYGYLEVDEYDLIGTYSLNAKTSAGAETDRTGIYFYFYDGSEAYNEIEVYGTATLTWTYGPAKGGSQKATLSVTMTGCGNDDCYIDDYTAIPSAFSATGSGSGSEKTNSVPFYYEY